MSDWSWRLLDASGAAIEREGEPTFPTQSDAESWVGETWRELLDSGVDAVTLVSDGAEVYGPMSLQPLE